MMFNVRFCFEGTNYPYRDLTAWLPKHELKKNNSSNMLMWTAEVPGGLEPR